MQRHEGPGTQAAAALGTGSCGPVESTHFRPGSTSVSKEPQKPSRGGAVLHPCRSKLFPLHSVRRAFRLQHAAERNARGATTVAAGSASLERAGSAGRTRNQAWLRLERGEAWSLGLSDRNANVEETGGGELQQEQETHGTADVRAARNRAAPRSSNRVAVRSLPACGEA